MKWCWEKIIFYSSSESLFLLVWLFKKFFRLWYWKHKINKGKCFIWIKKIDLFNNPNKQKPILSITEISLGVSTGLKARELTQAKELVKKSVKKGRTQIGIDNTKLLTIKRFLGSKLPYIELKSVIATISQLYQIPIINPLKRKKRCTWVHC